MTATSDEPTRWPLCTAPEGCLVRVRAGGLCSKHGQAEAATGHPYEPDPTSQAIFQWKPCKACGTLLHYHPDRGGYEWKPPPPPPPREDDWRNKRSGRRR